MNEIYKDIDGYEGRYQVSNLGNIKSLGNYINILKPQANSAGYKKILLYKNESNKSFLMHRLVAIAFIPNPENKRCVNHKNGIKTDNRLENLEWMTHTENMQHACKNKLMKSPGRPGIPIAQYTLDGKFIKNWKSSSQAERELKILSSCINKCCKGLVKRAGKFKWKYI